MATSEQKPTPTRSRPWQFSLRVLLQVMLCVPLFFAGWMANEFHHLRDRSVFSPRYLPPPPLNVQLQELSASPVKDFDPVEDAIRDFQRSDKSLINDLQDVP